MREDYLPSEKYRSMFGVERNGYGMERVDLYLAQLETAFKKIRESNRELKRELAARQAEADELRQQLRFRAEAYSDAAAYVESVYPSASGEDKSGLIGKVLIEARLQAEETILAAQQQADLLTSGARKRAEELRAEQDRIYSQLQSMSYALRGLLRDSAQTDYQQQRSEEFAAS